MRALLDTGPLVAMLVARDRHHAWTVDWLTRLEAPLLTCEAVISEACFLVRTLPGGQDAVLSLVTRGVIKVGFSLAPEAPAIRRLMKQYASVPMSLADACLVRLSEMHPQSRLMTLDSDFEIYRRARKQRIPLLTPA